MQKIFLAILFFIVLIAPNIALAQGPVTLSITPPLIKNNVNPGQVWQSYIKLVNNNPVEITAYVEVSDFKSGGQSSSIEFYKAGESPTAGAYGLSSWIVIDPGPIVIPPNQSREIPFIIDVPEDAGPGGHYAAILAGTKPPKGSEEGASIRISSLLASLILLNVKGEVVESGRIREFSTPKQVFNQADVDFSLRFENRGNVHIQPQGEIKVSNIFNKDRGVLTINHNSEYGNVLPGETRQWTFNWQGEDSILEMGRYRADLILSYGENGRQTDERAIYFWVIYWRPVIIIAGSILFLALLLFFFIRLSIRRAVIRTQEMYGARPLNTASPAPRVADLRLKPLPPQPRPVFKKGVKMFFLFGIVLAFCLIVFGLYYILNQAGENSASRLEETSPDNIEIINQGILDSLEELEETLDQSLEKGNVSF